MTYNRREVADAWNRVSMDDRRAMLEIIQEPPIFAHLEGEDLTNEQLASLYLGFENGRLSLEALRATWFEVPLLRVIATP